MPGRDWLRPRGSRPLPIGERVCENAPGITAYDNAMAEPVIGLFKTEVIRHGGPWRTLDNVEFATLEWVAWFNTCRLMEPLGYLSPPECEKQLDRLGTVTVTAADWCTQLTESPTIPGRFKNRRYAHFARVAVIKPSTVSNSERTDEWKDVWSL